MEDLQTISSVVTQEETVEIPKLNSFLREPSEKEFLDGIQPIFTMVDPLSCSMLEARIQAAKMLCDVSQKDIKYLNISSFRMNCIQALKSLISDEDEEVRQYAVMAISTFSEIPSYMEAFVHSNILISLFEIIDQYPSQEEAYATAQIRRTAASTLALLTRTHPYSVYHELNNLQHCNINEWLQRISCIHDKRTRDNAMIIKQYINDVSIGSSTSSNDKQVKICLDTDKYLFSASV